MKSLKKRIISVCSAMVLLIVSIVAGVPSQTVFATQDRSANFDKSYSLTGVYAQDMVNIARAQLGKSGSDLGYSEHWCANFATDCARLTGMSDQIIPYNYSSRGRVIDLFKYMINNCSTSYVKNGSSVVSQPQAGDLLFTDTSGKYNIENLHHVAIVVAYDASTGKITHIGGNQGDGYITTTHVTQVQQYTLNNANVAYILRPNYVDRPIIEPKIEISGENYPSNPHTPGNNFGIEGIITSNNKLDRVWGGVYSTDGTKVQYYDYNPNSWTVNLHGAFNNNIIFDNLPIGSYTYKIEARDITGYSKVLFDPYAFTVGEISKPSNVKVSIPKTEYMKGEKIVFTPSGTNVTGGYTIGIDDASGTRLITETFAVGSTYSTSALASGNYSAYVTAYNDSGYTDSGRIYFSVGITATFNANGGSCGTASKRVVTGDKYGNLPVPTLSGHTFTGWYTAASGGNQVTSGTAVSFGVNHTLYAHWIAEDYTIVFNKNGGSGSMSNQSMMRDQSVALMANAFTRTGYLFSSWNTKADGSGTSYSDKASVKNLAAGGGSITLYAIWKPNTYTVKYDANTGLGTMDNSTMTYDTAANLRKNTYTRTGYTFESWSDGNGNYYADQASVKNLVTHGTITLWVKWKPNTYTVTLDDGSGKTTTINVTYDSKYKISDPHGKDGYNFAGWYTEPDGKGTLISADTTVKITSNQTLYAYWSKVHYLISFNANGGTSELSQKRVSYDTKYGILPLAEKQGYEFGGWYLDEGLTQQITADSIVKITKNQEVYAKWVQIKLIVTFDPNGGIVDMDTKKVVSGKVYGVLPEAEKDGFEFVGWFTESGTEITSDSVVEFIEDNIVYAKWRLKGDVDADGDVDIDDVIMLQQWLLAVPDATLNDWRAGDLCQDERIDVFDLCLLKRMLIERVGDTE